MSNPKITNPLKINRFLYVVFCMFFVFQSCEDENRKRIPYAPVSLKLNLTTQYPTFRYNITDTLVFTQPRKGYEYQDRTGYGGVVVVIGFSNAYYAYDLCCPYEADAKIRVFPQSDGEAFCKVCGSRFQLLYGSGNVVKGPSRWALKSYQIEHGKGVEEYLYVHN